MTGKIYYIVCTETKRLKIGYTSGPVNKRLRALQTGSAGLLSLIAVHSGTLEKEQELHDQFSSSRLHGEWFEMTEELLQHICMIVWLQAKQSMILGEAIEEWVRIGLATMNETIAPLPKELANLI